MWKSNILKTEKVVCGRPILKKFFIFDDFLYKKGPYLEKMKRETLILCTKLFSLSIQMKIAHFIENLFTALVIFYLKCVINFN